MGRICDHLKHFWPVYFIIAILLCSAVLASFGKWEIAHILSIVSLVLFCICLFTMPMNIIYGFIGTSGSISIFLFLLLIFNLAFSGIYYKGFFLNAGISYDLNQPYVSFNLFSDKDYDSIQVVESVDTSYIYAVIYTQCGSVENQKDSTSNVCVNENICKIKCSDSPVQISLNKETRRYQHVGFWTIFQNTLLTSLMQESTDLFAIASSYNDIEASEVTGNGNNPEKWEHDRDLSRMFSWVLILQVFISWIFFGVFISILYNKFRYES